MSASRKPGAPTTRMPILSTFVSGPPSGPILPGPGDPPMKQVLKIVVSLVLVVVLLGTGGYAWAKGRSAALLGRTIETHTADFAVPFPLDSAEIAAGSLTPEAAAALALERAVERGRHLVESRYSCTECHGQSFGGGTMVDDAMLGRILGPNITAGQGGKTARYVAADWDRIVRHGIKPDGRPGAMPSQDFKSMSDRELSDIVAYIRSRPVVDAEVPPVSLGPLGTVLVATGKLPLSADLIGDHVSRHAVVPPVAEASVEFGRHVAGVCMGCHKADLTGGKVPGGDPSWPPAANLTPAQNALGSWTYEQFVAALRDGLRPDGTLLRAPMAGVTGYTRNMTDTELEALWMYLRTLPPAAAAGG
ncbi:MAG: cytochrome c [Gemmatimonadetes bacterium]|nr:cytochrome c [Gemmatimonadota bacterium]